MNSEEENEERIYPEELLGGIEQIAIESLRYRKKLKSENILRKVESFLPEIYDVVFVDNALDIYEEVSNFADALKYDLESKKCFYNPERIAFNLFGIIKKYSYGDARI